MPKHGQVLRQFVALGDKPEDCWTWIGKVSKRTGYGYKQFNGETIPAHRWVYQMLLGPIPDGLVINHLCRNRKCVNPHHLEVTTVAGNCRHGMGTRLTEEQVREIKAEFSTKKWGSGARLARKFGVSSALIHDIWRGRAWNDVHP